MRFAPRLGGAIFLLIVGLVLWIALPGLTDTVPLGTIGMILTIVGAGWLLIELVFSFSSGRNTTSERTRRTGANGKTVETEHEVETR